LTTDIQHVAGKANLVGDCLSRAIVGAVHLGLDYTHMAVDQAADANVQALKSAGTGLKLEDVAFPNAGATFLSDVSTGQPPWPIIPSGWRQLVFNAVHGLFHPGKKASQRLVAVKLVWHRLKKETGSDTCVVCQWAKVNHHIKAPLVHFPVPERSFNHIHVDQVGSCPTVISDIHPVL